MRGAVLAGAMVLLAVSAGAQERPGSRGDDGRMTVRVRPGNAGWYGAGYGGAGYGSYWRLDAAGRPYARVSDHYSGDSRTYAVSGWTADSEDGYGLPEYRSLSRERYQRSWRGYIILPPNFAEESEPDAEGR